MTNETIDNIKSGNYEVVDNRGVFVTRHFTQCLEKEFADLEAKLAEKDEQINKLEFIVEEIEQFVWEQLNNDNFDKYKAYDEMFTKIKQLTRNSHYEKQCQDKISFAVEQLEKVKEKILSYEEIYYQFLESGAKVPVVCLENFRVKQTIDNQINQLKIILLWRG